MRCIHTNYPFQSVCTSWFLKMIKCHANKCIFLWMPIDFCWQRALPTLLPPLRLHTQHERSFWFSISSKHVVLLCRSLIKILKVNQFVCLLPRGLSPFNPHFSKILKEVQFGNSYSNDIFGNLFKWNLYEMLCMLTEESIL